MCTLNLNAGNPAEQTLEQRQFLKSLFEYVTSESFAPTQRLQMEKLDRIFWLMTDERYMGSFFTIRN